MNAMSPQEISGVTATMKVTSRDRCFSVQVVMRISEERREMLEDWERPTA